MGITRGEFEERGLENAPQRDHDPGSVLRTRLAARRVAAAALGQRDARIAMGRLLTFGAVLATGVAAFLHRAAPPWLILPGAGYLCFAIAHEGTLRALRRARRAVAFYEAALARMDDRWVGTGDGGERYASDEHPYARDLDLFGTGSLFELLCTARTRPGADTLARWLLEPAGAAEVRSRQGAVAELSPQLDLREDVAVLGEDVRVEVHPEHLVRWAAAPRALSRWLAFPAAALAALALTTLVLSWTLNPVPFALTVAAEWLLSLALRGRLRRVLGGVERPGTELTVLAGLLARLEREPFRHERLVELRRILGDGRAAASTRIGTLGRIIECASWADNQLFAPLAFLVQWRLLAGLLVERWRAKNGSQVQGWLAAAGDLEAISSLAAYAFLRPRDPYPEVAEADAGALFEAEALGHPLLPRASCITNDVRLGRGTRLLVVSGSNMSGKSTLLRSVGTNAVLALAGAPVCARRLLITPVKVGATLRIEDSLAAGRSRFWAEITRLRAVMDLAGSPPPVLFLFDELLAGTNSRDRRLGAQAILRSFLARGAMGLATTHDLALSEIAASLAEAQNAHFEDEVRDGEVVFDYRLRPGVAASSNALALMRAVGLDF